MFFVLVLTILPQMFHNCDRKISITSNELHYISQTLNYFNV